MSEAPSSLDRAIHDQLSRLLAGGPDREGLTLALRQLAKWRSKLLDNTLVARSGRKVLSGPFAGLDYTVTSAEGALAARLLGVYEASLHPVIEEIVARAPELVIDVGCAEGYYAVGLARRLPGARIRARDSNPAAQEKCRKLSQDNGVATQVDVGGTLDHDDLAVCTEQPTVLICDIEGAEIDLLDPSRAPALAEAAILVECHDTFRPGLTDTLAARFAPTHAVTRIDRSLSPTPLPAWTEALSDLDRLLLLWEWRGGPTPWLWMLPRGG